MVRKTNPTQRELDRAFLAGFRTSGDPEMLEEIGIPVLVDDFNKHVQAGRDVAAAISRNGTPVSAGTVRKIAVFCGDCLDDVVAGESCEHISVDTKGKINGRYPRN